MIYSDMARSIPIEYKWFLKDPFDLTLTTTLSQSGPGSTFNDEVIYISHTSRTRILGPDFGFNVKTKCQWKDTLHGVMVKELY